VQERRYTFTLASAATGTNKQYVGPHDRAFLVVSGLTGFNAGAGNTTIDVRGGLSATDTHATITSCVVATMTIKGVYPLPYPGLDHMSIGFGTAVTGTASNTIDVIVYETN